MTCLNRRTELRTSRANLVSAKQLVLDARTVDTECYLYFSQFTHLQPFRVHLTTHVYLVSSFKDDIFINHEPEVKQIKSTKKDTDHGIRAILQFLLLPRICLLQTHPILPLFFTDDSMSWYPFEFAEITRLIKQCTYCISLKMESIRVWVRTVTTKYGPKREAERVKEKK